MPQKPAIARVGFSSSFIHEAGRFDRRFEVLGYGATGEERDFRRYLERPPDRFDGALPVGVALSTWRCSTSLSPLLYTSARKSTTSGSRNSASSSSLWLMLTPRTLKKPTVRRSCFNIGNTLHGPLPFPSELKDTRSPEDQRRKGVMQLFQSGVTTSEPTAPSGTGSPLFSSSTSQ